MKKPVISFQKVSKSFDLYREEKLKNFLNPFKNVSSKRKIVLDKITFEIHKKETVGLYGPNGSGKSTLLRLIANILKQDAGKIYINGTVAAVLELGAGLHPDLSGRENIELYGSLLGINKKILKLKEKKIIKFSELADYIDLPIKKYSSGMKSRLAFSIAAFSDADIILLDEVFAVGDKNFVDKSQALLEKIKKEKTIVLSSHNIQLLQGFCDRVIRMSNHKIDNRHNLYELLFKIPKGQYFQTKITSNSMYPLFKKGDTVKVEKIALSSVKNDDVVAAYFENIQEIVIHRVLAKNNKGGLILQGDNNYSPDKWLVKKENFLGKVIL